MTSDKKFGLSISKKDGSSSAKKSLPTTVANIFSQDSDEEEKDTSAAHRFDQKYSSGSKK